MEIKRVALKELPEGLTHRLNYLCKAESGEFIVAVDDVNNVMYVNKESAIPETDINAFVECIDFPHSWVCDEEIGKGQLMDYIFEKYGSNTYLALMKSHKWCMRKKETRRTRETAKTILPLIKKEVFSDSPIVECDEDLIFEIWDAGYSTHAKTRKNRLSYSSLYLFYFGYLMGAGMLHVSEA